MRWLNYREKITHGYATQTPLHTETIRDLWQ